jgi:hypothetical protein
MTDKIIQAGIADEMISLWETNLQPAGCSNCRRVYLVLPSQLGNPCPLCRNGLLNAQPARMRLSEPEKILPFKINTSQLHTIFSNFVGGVWIKLPDFNVKALLKRTVPVFWPLWLVDCDVDGVWQMEAGFDYQVESGKETFANGQWHSVKQIETRIRWDPRLGELSTHIDNIAVPALEEHQNRQSLTGAYKLDAAHAFDPALLKNALLEVPDLPPGDAWQLAKPQVNTAVGDLCQQATDAQHGRNFALKADYQHQNWTQFYLPLYAAHYLDDDGQPQIVIINGATGEIRGPRLASRKRGLKIAGIIAAVAGVFFLLALLGLLLSLVWDPARSIAALLGVLGLATGMIAIIPAAWPAQWNRRQTGPRIKNPTG